MIRPLEARDHAAVAALLNLVRQPPATSEDKTEFLTGWRPEYPALHLVDEGPGGTITAYGTAYMASWIKPGRMRVQIVVEPAQRGQAAGRGLYERLLAFARQSGVALAMKLRALEVMKAAGIQKVKTNNHARNAPMLRINEKLGFPRLHGTYMLFKAL